MKKIVRLTESDLVKLVKRVVNEQMKISQVPSKESANVDGKTLTSGEKIIIRNDDGNFNYYGTIDEINYYDNELTLTVNGGVLFGIEVETAIKRKREPFNGEVMFGRNCSRFTIRYPKIGQIQFTNNLKVHTVNFSRLNPSYLMDTNKDADCNS
jgi:hypothetical protein